MHSVQSEEQTLYQLGLPCCLVAGFRLKPNGARDICAARCPWRCWYSNIVYAASYTRLVFCGCCFAALLPDGISAFLSSSLSLSLSIFLCAFKWLRQQSGKLYLRTQSHIECCVIWLTAPSPSPLYFFYFYSFLLTYSRWMCSPTNRFCIETLSGHLQCVPRQRPAARQGCAPAGRFQWRHRWCPAAWAALHRWFWRPSLSVREISPKYCEEKSEEKFSLNDSLHKSKLLQNLTIKFANSSSDHPRT